MPTESTPCPIQSLEAHGRLTTERSSLLSKTKFDCTALFCPRLKSNKVDFFLFSQPAQAEKGEPGTGFDPCTQKEREPLSASLIDSMPCRLNPTAKVLTGEVIDSTVSHKEFSNEASNVIPPGRHRDFPSPSWAAALSSDICLGHFHPSISSHTVCSFTQSKKMHHGVQP